MFSAIVRENRNASCKTMPIFFRYDAVLMVRMSRPPTEIVPQPSGSEYILSNNSINVPQARQAMEQFKQQAASEVGVNLKQGHNGDLTSREAGSVVGQMVKKMIESYEQNMK